MTGLYIGSDYTGASSTVNKLSSIAESSEKLASAISAYTGNLGKMEGPLIDLINTRMSLYTNVLNTLAGKIQEAITSSINLNDKISSIISPEPELSSEKISQIKQNAFRLGSRINDFRNHLKYYNRDNLTTTEKATHKALVNTITKMESNLEEVKAILDDLEARLEDAANVDSSGSGMVGNFNSDVSKINISI